MESLFDYLAGLDPQRLLVIRIVMAVLLVLLAIFGARLFRAIVNTVERRLQGIAPRWLHILVQGFTEPLVLLARAVLLYCALLAAPVPLIDTVTLWALLTPFLRAAAIFLIGWGFWRSAPLCRLLLGGTAGPLELTGGRTVGAFFENIYRFIVGLFTVLIILDIFGVPVASLVAGAGIAGLAVSLAAQSTISNLIAGVALVLEHPFGIGDYISLNEFEGTVEDISFRSTRLRTPDNVAITVENTKVCSEYIQNLNDRTSRLWTFTLRLPYDTPYAKLDALCADIRACLQADAQIDPACVMVTVDAIGEDGIKVLLRAYTTTADYNTYLLLRDRLDRAILRLLEQNGCSLAYPPLSVYGPKTE